MSAGTVTAFARPAPSSAGPIAKTISAKRPAPPGKDDALLRQTMSVESSVIALRLMKIAGAAPDTGTECARMVTEKIKAAADAQRAVAVALAQGKSTRTATKRTMTPIKRRVRANHRRLGGK
jgi:hypothetical protein